MDNIELHALIFARICKVPVLPIVHDTKIFEYAKIMKRLNKEILEMVIRLMEASAEPISSFLREIYND